MQKKVLIISTTPFYGGGESFIVKTLDKIANNNVYFVNNVDLCEKLEGKEVSMFKSQIIASQILEINSYLRKHKEIKNVIFNGGNTVFFLPFVQADNKIYYRHTTNMCIENIFRRFFFILMWNFCYFFADRIIHVSNYSLNEQKLFRSKALCIYHGVDNDVPYIERSSVKSFLYVGRLDRTKGIDIIIDAFKKLSQNDFVLDIVGNGELEEYVKANVCPNIKYWGFRSDVNPFYKRADAFITLPTNEAFGLTIIEAMRFSLPIITCRTGGIGEIVNDHVNGLLVSRTPNSIIEAIKELRDNVVLYKKCSSESYSKVTCHFTRTNTINKIKEILI